MTYLIRYAIAESNFMKALILRHFVAYGIPNLNSLQINKVFLDKVVLWQEVFYRYHKNILHPPDRKKIHGYASCERHFLYYRRRENAVWRVGGEWFLRQDSFCQRNRPGSVAPDEVHFHNKYNVKARAGKSSPFLRNYLLY